MSLENIERCPVCDGRGFKPFLECQDHTATGELFHVEQCTECGMLLTNPRPTVSAAPTYYQSAEYISHKSSATGPINSIYLIMRWFTLRWKYSLVKPFLTRKTLLDFGCGTGAFLQHCQRAGVNVFGVEPSEEARALAETGGIKATATINEIPDHRCDVITMWHVLEHVYDLDATLKAIHGRLDDHGTIFIAVPNWQSHDAATYGSHWAAYDLPRHIWHFSKEHMTKLLEKSGFKLIRVLPMKLDAYYVSLLSEKYKANGKLGPSNALHGLITAYQSNRHAAAHMNYSSLIYIAQK